MNNSIKSLSVLGLVLLLGIGTTGEAYGDKKRSDTPGMETGETPTNLVGTKVLTAEALRRLIDASGASIFDVRKKISYVESHVPTAKSAATAYDSQAKKIDVTILGPDKSAPIVFYSHGPDGWKSYWSAKTAVEAGYSNVMWFRGGFAAWDKKELPLAR
ncbi:MAG: rhodanese-like domain-containing protein [Hyphomicrobium sp.]